MRYAKVLAGALLLVMTACGSDDASPGTTAAPTTAAITTVAPTTTGATTTTADGTTTTAGGTTTASPTTKAGPATGEPIVIGSLVQADGPLAGDLGLQTRLALDAWAEDLNSHGGIDGRPVKVVIEDDGGQPAVAQQKIEKLVNDDKVVALVGIQSPTRNWLPFVEQSGVPVLGGFVSSGEYVDHVNMFAANGTGGRIGPFATLSALKSVGATKVGIMACAEVPACAQAAAPYEAMAPTMGMEYAGVQTVSASAPNYSAQCLAMKQEGADAVALFVVGATSVRIIQDCAAQGYKPHFSALLDRTSAEAKLDGVVGSTYTAPWFLDKTPGQQELQRVVGAKISDKSATSKEYGNGLSVGFAAAKLFERAALDVAAKGGEVTSATLIEAIKAIPVGDSTLDGLVGEIDYSKPSSQQGACFFIIGLTGGEWATPSGTDPICAPPAGS